MTPYTHKIINIIMGLKKIPFDISCQYLLEEKKVIIINKRTSACMSNIPLTAITIGSTKPKNHDPGINISSISVPLYVYINKIETINSETIAATTISI
jgi:hypothetical protein